jgi:hypothetical protein
VFFRPIASALLAVLALLAIVEFARQTPPIVTDSDFAVTELYTELATRGRLLIGPYSRFGWNHPGPIYFYLQAPLYAASGHRAAALYAVPVAINLAAIATLAWVVARTNRGPLLLFVILACVIFAWRAPRLLASPWTAHVPVMPALAFMVLCAGVAGGRPRLLPLALGFGSFITQTHVGFLPLAAALSVIAIAAIALDKRERAQSLFILSASACVLLALWSLPVSEALSHAGGNLAAVWRFFVTGSGAGHSVQEALANWSYGICGLFRPDFALPWGGHFVLRYLWCVVPCALGQLLALLIITIRESKSGRRFESALSLSALVASVVGLWAVSRIEGDILDHEIFWLTALGALNLAIIGAAALEQLARTRLEHWTVRWAATAGCVVLLTLVLQLGVTHLRDLTAFERRRTERARIPATYGSIRDYVRKEAIRKPLIDIDGDVWSDGAGVLLRFLQDGTSAAVTDSSVRMFTDAFRVNGDEDALVTISSHEGRQQEMASRPGNVALRDARHPYVNAVRLTPTGR